MKQLNFGQIFSGYLGLFSFGALVFPKLAAPLIVMLLILVVIGYIRSELRFKLYTPGIFMMLLYLAYFIGIFFAHELTNGLKYAEYKLSLLLIPLLLSVKPKFQVKLQAPLLGLIGGTIVLAGIGLLSSCNCYDRHPWFMYCFSSSYISPIHHPSYFAGFLLFATTGAWYGWKKKWKGFSLFSVIAYTVFALVFYFFCMSLAGILFLGIVLGGLVVYALYKKWGRWIALSVLFIGPILLYVVIGKLPGLREDVHITTKGLTEYISNSHAFLMKRVKDPEIPGNQKRLVMWTVTAELISEHPMGVGTGNVDEYLHARLNRYGFDQLVADDLNPHNQYLQTMLEIGVVGLLLVIGLIASCMYLAIKKRNFLLLLLISGLAFNMLFESMLQRQSGVVFYSFWIPVMILVIGNTANTLKNRSNE